MSGHLFCLDINETVNIIVFITYFPCLPFGFFLRSNASQCFYLLCIGADEAMRIFVKLYLTKSSKISLYKHQQQKNKHHEQCLGYLITEQIYAFQVILNE